MNVDKLNECTGTIIDGAIQIHSALGPGLLESAYLACLAHELRSRGVFVQCQVALPLTYKAIRLEVAYRIDKLVERELVVEVKAISKLQPIHDAQLLSYLRLSNRRVGLLLNFHVPRMKDGIKRLANRF